MEMNHINNSQNIVKGSQFYADKVLLEDGIFKCSQDIGEKFLLALDVDRLISPLYTAAGMTPKGVRYGGWEDVNMSNGDISGQALGIGFLLLP